MIKLKSTAICLIVANEPVLFGKVGLRMCYSSVTETLVVFSQISRKLFAITNGWILLSRMESNYRDWYCCYCYYFWEKKRLWETFTYYITIYICMYVNIPASSKLFSLNIIGYIKKKKSKILTYLGMERSLDYVKLL